MSVFNGRGRGGRGVTKSRAVVADRLAAFARLREHCSVPVAADQVGVTHRTGYRYEALRRAAQGGDVDARR